MKKFLTGIALVLLLIQLPLIASAAQPATITLTPDKVSAGRGETVSVTVSISTEEAFSSVGYLPEVDSNVFEIVGGEVLAPETAISEFSITDGGVLMFSSPKAYTGPLFRMDLKVKTDAASGKYTVGGTVNAKTSSTQLDVALSGCQITVACQHNVSWTEKTDLIHSGSCTLCQAPFSGEHDWDEGTRTKDPTCKEQGVIRYTCGVCGHTKEEYLDKLPSHSMGDWVMEGGMMFKSCTSCGEREYAPDGWHLINNQYYYTHNGEMHTSWLSLNGVWYFMDDAGVMQTGWQKIAGIWYYFEGGGAMQTGWQNLGGTWYYFEGGAMQTGWQNLGGTWYYFEGGGAMQTGWQLIGSTWYYFEGGGAMQTGWQLIGSTWYYFEGGGAMQTGWIYLGDTWYYLDPGGAMVTGWQLIDGTWYLFNDGGAWIG